MLLYVYNKELTLLGVVENITSLVWNEKKYSYGTFTMLLPATEANISLLQKNRIIIRDDDVKKVAGEVLYINIKKDISGSEVLEVTGKLLSHWLNDRLLLSEINLVAAPQTIMRQAVNTNAISAAVAARNYPNLILGTTQGSGSNIEYKNEENITLLDLVEDISITTDTGFNITADVKNKRYKFNTYSGTDHTINSASPCIFSLQLENILEQEYIQSIENLKNVAYVAGEENALSAPVIIGNATGHERKEVFVNASSIKKANLTDAEYAAVLATNGEIALQSYIETTNFYNKINANNTTFIYGVDYDLGDKVTCINAAWHIAVDAVITEAQTTYEDGQKTVYLTFGDALPTLFEKLKKLN